MENQTPQQNPVNTGQANMGNNSNNSQPQVQQVNPQMATNIPDLENGQNAAQPKNNQNNSSQPEDMFEGIPSMSDEGQNTAPPQINANEPLRPQKKSSNFLTILFIVIVIIALLGGVVLAYNFWVNSSSEGENINGMEESGEFVEPEEEVGSFDDTYDDDIEFEVTETETDTEPEEDFDEEEIVEGDMGVSEDITEIMDVQTGTTDVELPPINGEDEVLDYEEENDELNVEDLPESINDLLGDESEEQANPEEENVAEDDVANDPEGDIDEDGLTNAEEEALGTNLYKADSDNDGLNDREEVMVYDTDPLNSDTDGDGYLDGEEVANGYNPNGEGLLE